MGKLSYRVLYNQDCTNIFAITRDPMTPEHVDHMVDEVADSGVEVLLVNPNAQRVNYPSTAWQVFWDGYAPGDRAFFGPVPDEDVPGREHFVAQMRCLADQGCDYLARALARCRARGIAPGVSVRMNDMHDVPWPGSHLFSRFYLEHPAYHLQNPPVCNWAATGLNYAHAAVREHYLSLLRELVASYDFEVLELDFLRFHSYFPREHFTANCAVMTGFLREVRALLASANRPIALVPRVAATPAAAFELGFDVAAWAREGLIDGMTAGAFFNSAWAIAVEDYRALVGDAVSLYASPDVAADRRGTLPRRILPLDADLLRGFAAGYHAAGADGICLFNFFCPREGATPRDPLFNVLADLAHIDHLRTLPRRHTLTTGDANAETDGPFQAPQFVPTNQPRAFALYLTIAHPNARVTAEILLDADHAPNPAGLWLHVNDYAVGAARAITTPTSVMPYHLAAFDIPPTALRDGRNSLILRNEGEPVTVISIDVGVT